MNGLPRVTINIADGRLGQVAPSADGISGLIITGSAVSGTIALNTPIQIFSLAEAQKNGITPDDNDFAYQQVKLFYEQTGTGAPLWVMLVGATIKMSDMVDQTKNYAPKLLAAAKGSIRLLSVSRKSTDTGLTIENGLDADVALTLQNVNELARTYAENYQDFFTVVDGKDFNGNVGDLENYREADLPFSSIFIANANGSKNADVGLLLGRLANDPVQRAPHRVKTGSLSILKGYLTDGSSIEELPAADALHDKGYIFMREFVGRAGVFFTASPNTNLASSDLNRIERVRTIYKARRVAYQTLVNEIGDEVPLDQNGEVSAAYIKSFQALVDNALVVSMVANGELNAVETTIDPTQNILSTNELKVTIDLLPVGYNDRITVELGFTVQIN